MDESLQALGHQNRYDLKSLLTPPDDGLYRCRVLYGADCFEVQYVPYRKRSVTSLQPIEADDLEYGLKYSDRTPLDALAPYRGDADDLLIIKAGYVTDTTIANIAFFDGARWLTPKAPLLKGTTRARLLEEGVLHESMIHISTIGDFSSFALMNAMIGLEVIKDGIILPLKRQIEGDIHAV